jgi:hypothetical protein
MVSPTGNCGMMVSPTGRSPPLSYPTRMTGVTDGGRGFAGRWHGRGGRGRGGAPMRSLQDSLRLSVCPPVWMPCASCTTMLRRKPPCRLRTPQLSRHPSSARPARGGCTVQTGPHARMRILTYLCTYACVNVCVYVCTCVYVRAHVCACASVCEYVQRPARCLPRTRSSVPH